MALFPGASMEARATDLRDRLQTLPGLRTLASERFRELIAAVLWLLGVLLLAVYVIRSGMAGGSQAGIDFADYHAAAGALAAGGSPYAPSMLEGPVPAQGLGAYRYPPPLAQLLMPLAALPLLQAALLWASLQVVALFSATWLALTARGAPATRERFLWSGVATTYFLPAFDSVWKGNVSGFLALAVALALTGGTAAAGRRPLVTGVAMALVSLVKLTPAALLLPVASAAVGGARHAQRMLLAAVATAALVLLPSVALSPDPWRDYATVLPNLLAGPADYPTNLAPGSLAAIYLPAAPWLAPLVRLLAVAGGLGLVGLGLGLARRPGRWAAAVAAATAGSLLIPAATWYHYLAVLLPLAAFAWPKATLAQRGVMLAGAGLVYAGFGWFLPLALPGSIILNAVVLLALRQSTARPTPETPTPETHGSVA